jgi:hypothetical protein
MPPTERLRWGLLSGYPGRPPRIQTAKVPSDSKPGEVTIVAEGGRDARYNARRSADRCGLLVICMDALVAPERGDLRGWHGRSALGRADDRAALWRMAMLVCACSYTNGAITFNAAAITEEGLLSEVRVALGASCRIGHGLTVTGRPDAVILYIFGSQERTGVALASR